MESLKKELQENSEALLLMGFLLVMMLCVAGIDGYNIPLP